LDENIPRASLANHCTLDQVVTLKTLQRFLNQHNLDESYEHRRIDELESLVQTLQERVEALELERQNEARKLDSVRRKVLRLMTMVHGRSRCKPPYRGDESPENTEYESYSDYLHDSNDDGDSN